MFDTFTNSGVEEGIDVVEASFHRGAITSKRTGIAKDIVAWVPVSVSVCVRVCSKCSLLLGDFSFDLHCWVAFDVVPRPMDIR
jgi:hypothetical protein